MHIMKTSQPEVASFDVSRRYSNENPIKYSALRKYRAAVARRCFEIQGLRSTALKAFIEAASSEPHRRISPGGYFVAAWRVRR